MIKLYLVKDLVGKEILYSLNTKTGKFTNETDSKILYHYFDNCEFWVHDFFKFRSVEIIEEIGVDE
jgi:hypothetical protein